MGTVMTLKTLSLESLVQVRGGGVTVIGTTSTTTTTSTAPSSSPDTYYVPLYKDADAGPTGGGGVGPRGPGPQPGSTGY